MSPSAAAIVPATVVASQALVSPRAYESLPTVSAGFNLGAPIELESLPAPAFIQVRHEMPRLPDTSIRLAEPASAGRLDGGFQRAADDDSGFLASAFRRTGTSIVKTGVRTGTSVVDAVRIVGSVFRRALPD
jgi:hypothetical protein